MKTIVKYDDGGREAAGYKGSAGDCVVRAVAIAAELDYKTIYQDMARINQRSHVRNSASGRRSARNGVNVRSKGFRDYMAALGWKWTPTMQIGSGCKVHLRADELPAGRIICAVSKHYTTMIDGVIHDTFDPSRGGTRCVYGYWSRLSGYMM